MEHPKVQSIPLKRYASIFDEAACPPLPRVGRLRGIIGGCVGVRARADKAESDMENDFVDVFPSGDRGVGGSPVKAPTEHGGSSWARPAISLSIPGIDTGGSAAAVSPAVPSQGVATPSHAKEGMLRMGRPVVEQEMDAQESPAPSPSPLRFGLTPMLTIEPGGEFVPTELEKKRAKLEKYRYVCSEVKV